MTYLQHIPGTGPRRAEMSLGPAVVDVLAGLRKSLYGGASKRPVEVVVAGEGGTRFGMLIWRP